METMEGELPTLASPALEEQYRDATARRESGKRKFLWGTIMAGGSYATVRWLPWLGVPDRADYDTEWQYLSAVHRRDRTETANNWFIGVGSVLGVWGAVDWVLGSRKKSEIEAISRVTALPSRQGTTVAEAGRICSSGAPWAVPRSVSSGAGDAPPRGSSSSSLICRRRHHHRGRSCPHGVRGTEPDPHARGARRRPGGPARAWHRCRGAGGNGTHRRRSLLRGRRRRAGTRSPSRTPRMADRPGHRGHRIPGPRQPVGTAGSGPGGGEAGGGGAPSGRAGGRGRAAGRRTPDRSRGAGRGTGPPRRRPA